MSVAKSRTVRPSGLSARVRGIGSVIVMVMVCLLAPRDGDERSCQGGLSRDQGTSRRNERMRIASAEVVVTSPGRNFVTLRITTEAGVSGVGDATLNGRELSVASYLQDHVGPLLIGRDADRIEDTWQYLYRGAYWRRGPVTMAAIAAVDMALWDIKGKTAGMPLYQLLGGASRDGLLAYGHASGRDLPELFDSVNEHLEQGYRAIRIQSAVPGLKSI